MQVMGIFDRFPALATSLNPDYEGFKAWSATVHGPADEGCEI